MSDECKPGFVRNSPLDHKKLRTLTSDGRCPICDPSVTREEYLVVLKLLMGELRKR